MDYIKQLNSFERWTEINYLPQLAQLIWYKLFALNNRAGWVEWLQVDNQRLMRLSGIKNEKTFITNRDKLIETGLVLHQRGKKGNPSKYKLIDLYTAECTYENEVNATVHSTVKTTVNPTVNPTAIYKLKQNKNKRDILHAKKENKNLFGEMQKVELTEPEYQKLFEQLGDIGVAEYIERLDGYVASTGKKYKSHYATILNWWRKDGKPVSRTDNREMKPDVGRTITNDMTPEEILG